MKKNFIVTIDGLSATGKGTLVRRLSEHYGWPAIGLGPVLRRIVYDIRNTNTDINDMAMVDKLLAAVDLESLTAPELQTEEIGNAAAAFCTGARADACYRFMRDFAGRFPHMLVEGRIAGRILPDADVKFYLTASLEARAKRKMNVLRDIGKCEGVTLDGLTRDLMEREQTESHLGELAIPDARTIRIDTNDLSSIEVEQFVVSEIDAALNNRKLVIVNA
ncbi:MAG: (d)CMP kinase [Bdellovibrionales bacterium]